MTDATRHVHLNSHLQQMMSRMISACDIPMPAADENENGNGDGDTAQDNTGAALASYENVGVPRQSQQTNVGRICNEAHDGKLNSTSLLLEGTRFGSNGARIELDVDNLAGYSLFQGQIVSVSGYNHSGRKMVVEKLMEGMEEGNFVKTPKEELKKMQYGSEQGCQNGEGIKVFAVAGPYTTNQNLDYQPLADLLGMVEEEKPDVVLLMGPFVDMRQDLIKDGEDLIVEFADGSKRHVSYEQFFAAKIVGELEAMYEDLPGLRTQFVIVPSLDDAVAEPV